MSSIFVPAFSLVFGQSDKYLALTISVSNESEDRTDSDLNGRIEIYARNGEDYTPLYESPALTRALKPIDIEDLDIKNCEFLEIRYYNNRIILEFNAKKIIVYAS